MSIIKNRKKLEKKLNQSLKVSKEEEYYIVNKNWMEEFLNFFEFKKFNSLRKENKVSEYDKVFSILKNDEIISKKIKEKNKFNNTQYLKKDKIDLGNITLKYYDNLEIINEEIKKLIEEFIKINIESKAKILLGDNKCFIHHNNDNFLLIGRLNNNLSYITYMLMMFKEHNYIDLYIDNFKINKFEDIIKNFKGLSNSKFSLLSGQLGIVYKINIDFEIEEILKTMKNQINKDKPSNVMKNNLEKKEQEKNNDESNQKQIEKDIDKNNEAKNSKNPEEADKNKKQSLINIISLMIDSEIIKRKISKSLKEANQEQYCLLNYEWFKKYIQLKNMTEIFNYLNESKILKSYINHKNEENIIRNKSNIIAEIIVNINNEMKNKISNPNNYISTLSNSELQQLEKAIIIKAKNDYIFFFKNYLLISYETKQIFLSEFNQYFKLLLNSCPVYFGDDKIFLIVQSQSENLIEMGTLNAQNIFQPTIIFEHIFETNLYKNIKLLISNGYTQYTNYYLLFNDNYISPIFDQNKNKIGRAYRYDEKMNDYSKYISQEEKVIPNHNIQSSNNINKIKEHNINVNSNPNKQNINNNNQQIDNNLNQKKPINAENYPKENLKNDNNRCNYINLVIACFCNINKFMNYFKSHHDNDSLANNNKKSLTYLFKNIIRKLLSENNQLNSINKYSSDINQIISSLLPSFSNSNNHIEIKDFVYFIIMTLHNELNKKNYISSNYVINPEQTNELIMWNIFSQKFINENKSIISDLFYGSFHIKMQCATCGIIKHNFEIFQFLIFNLENIKEYKINKLMNLNPELNTQQLQLNLNCFNNMNSVTIYDCFDFSSQVQNLSGDNAIPCDICKNLTSSYYQSVICTPPEILILIFDRSKKTGIKLEFIEDLNLSNYIEKAENTGYLFKLIGVVSQEGGNGKYIAYCKNLNNQQWVKYNNDSVAQINNFKTRIVDSGEINILFYQKCN